MVQQSQSSAPKRKSAAAGLNSGSTRPVKRRASKACQCCRSRKVRCDVVESGIPCTNCRLDEVECCVTEGKRRKKSCIETDILQASPITSVEDRDDIPQFPLFDDIDGLHDLSLPQHNSQSPSQSTSQLERELDHHKPHMLYQKHSLRITPEERTRRLSILSSRGIPIQNPAALTSPFFPPFTLQNDVVLPKYTLSIPNRILAEDIDYLQKKGAFLIPEVHIRNELLRCYVQYVHPYLPLLDLEEFLTAIHKNDGSSTISLLLFQAVMFAASAYIDMRYLTAQGYDSRKAIVSLRSQVAHINNDGSSTISLLLFQAVMFAASAYIDMRYLTAQGYDSRKAARKAFFSRVKLLYDFDYEIDRVVVVQSVLLMTYWYESPDDPKDIWHWLGVAISLARTIGLNCDTSTSPLSLQKQKLWKRIWWCCYMRDRLVALGMRRPIRIREDDFTVPVLETSDFEIEALPAEINRMIGGCSVMRDASKRKLLAEMCVAVVQCCQRVTTVLGVQYSMLGHMLGATQQTTMRLVPKKAAADVKEVTKCDRDLEQWYQSLPIELRYFKDTTPREQNIQNDGDVINLHRALLTGMYLTTTSALHRPQMMPAMPNLVIEPELKELSKQRVREASAAITDIFRDLYARDSIKYLPTTGVTILLPAIIVHLLDIKSPESATRQLSVRRFQFCMQALQKLRELYASADFAFSFLDAAIRKADVPVHETGEEPKSDQNTYGSSNQFSPRSKIGTPFPTTLTPPPELPTMEQIRSRASLSASPSNISHAINPQVMTLPNLDYQNTDYGALTPPSSDKMPNVSEGATTAGAAITLSDFNSMHFSPPTSIHDEHMGINSGAYVEADKLGDISGQLFDHMIDETAMENDFEQLINLEGGSGAMDQLFSDALNDISETGNSWSAASGESEKHGLGLSADIGAKLVAATQEAQSLRENIAGIVVKQDEIMVDA